MFICSKCSIEKKIPKDSFKEIFAQCDHCRYYSLCIEIPERLAKFLIDRLKDKDADT
jgi:hypothetical protein